MNQDISLIYGETTPPEDLVKTLVQSEDRPETPARPDFGLDSPLGLVASNVLAPLYLYATLKGKFDVWDEILDHLPELLLQAPSLDVGCGRGMVLLKTAERKKRLASAGSRARPAFAIDIFSTSDQSGNSPSATFKNAAAMGVVDLVVVHRASFTDKFPFIDGAFSLITSNLALHNAKKDGRSVAIKEMARVCGPGGKIIVVDLCGSFGDYKAELGALGFEDILVELVGMRMMFGILPCQMLTATRTTSSRIGV